MDLRGGMVDGSPERGVMVKGRNTSKSDIPQLTMIQTRNNAQERARKHFENAKDRH